jgi:hypothetical protein
VPWGGFVSAVEETTAVTERSFIEEIDDVAHLDEAIRGSREKRTCFAIHSLLKAIEG